MPELAAAFNDNLLSSVSAYGLALQAMGEAKINSSLLPEKIRRERLWQEKTKWFAAAAATFVLATGVAYTSWYFDHVQFQRDHAAHGDEIAKVLNTASGLNRQWGEIESSGGPDRQQIGMIDGLLWGRNIWPGLIQDITSSFPGPPSDPAKLTAMARSVKRSQRPIILLQDWSTHYQPGMKSILEMSDASFSAVAGVSATPPPVRNRIPFPTGGMPIPGRGSMGMYSRAAAPTPSVGASGSTPAADDSRGFLLTLRCTTPNAGRSTFVTSTLVKALRDLGAGQSGSNAIVSDPKGGRGVG